MKRAAIWIISLLALWWISALLEPPTRQPQVTSQPVVWETNNQLILLGEHEIVRHYLSDEDRDEILFSVPIEERAHTRLTGGCFSPNKWLFRVQTDYADQMVISSVTFHEFTNGIESSVSVGQRPYYESPFDCNEVTGAKPGKIRSIKDPANDLPSTIRPFLFAPTDAAYNFSAVDNGKLIVETESVFGNRRFELMASDRGDQWNSTFSWVNSVRDGQSSRYLLHRDHQRDPGDPKWWPKSAWAVDLSDGSINSLSLPPGPWVGNLKSGCFSCGCGCYRNVDLYMSNNEVYVHVWGYPYSANIQGIYALRFKSGAANWQQVVSGVVAHPIVFAPDGCRVAIARPGLEVHHVCVPSD